ncbi:MAG: hypothetical protein ACI82A_003872 [Candidatus Azotimanducaceae bacterium]
MGIFGNLWFGALLARGISPHLLASSVILCMLTLHVASGNISAETGIWWHLLDSIYLGLTSWLLLYGGNRMDQDLRDSTLEISDVDWQLRAPSKFAARLETTLALTIGLSFASLSWIIMQADHESVNLSVFRRSVIFARWVIDGAVLFHLGIMILRHRRWLHRYIDSSLRIDLLQIDRLSVLSNGFVMWLAVVACLIALPVMQVTLLQGASAYELVRIFGPLSIGLLVAGLLFTPILKTRSRIIDAQERERTIATTGLHDERLECGKLAIRCDGAHYSVAELLSYLRFLDAIWTWPIRRNLARISFYALIPPIAWVLSAMVEISLNVQLQ